MVSNTPEMTRERLSEIVLKEKASVTRIIELLGKNGYLKRKINKNNGRRYWLIPTEKGTTALDKIVEIITQNRITALEGINQEAQAQLKETLDILIKNCKK